MTPINLVRPSENEYLAYFGRYINLVPEGDILELLARQGGETQKLLKSLPSAKGDFRYAPEKWTVKELVGHVTDAERVFAHRALRFGRNDKTELPGFEENDYVKNASFKDFSLDELAAGFGAVRDSTIFLLKQMDSDAPLRKGSANGAEVSVRALAYIIAGHELHHLYVLKTRYSVA